MKECPACFHENPDDASICRNDDCRYEFDSGFGSEGTKIATAEITGFSEDDLISGRYRVVRELGRGGMGVVYLAADVEVHDDPVAVKMIHPNLLSSHEARQRFADEVLISRKLTDAGIVRVHDLKRWEGLRFFTMEYIDGRSLREWITRRKEKKPPFTLPEVFSVIDPLLKALSYAHQFTIHRDIKPENIMVMGEFPEVQMKVLDFGIAKTLSPSRFSYTAHALGTAYYMAPEQRDGEKEIDHRSDLYSVGIIFYEMLMGEIPDIFPELPSRVNPELPGEIDEIVTCLLKRSPEDRYADAEGVRVVLSNAMSAHEKLIERRKEEKEQLEKEEFEVEQKRKDQAERERKAEEERQRAEQERAEAEKRRREEEERKKEQQRRIEEEQRISESEREKTAQSEKQRTREKQKKQKFIGIIVALCVVLLIGVLVFQGQKTEIEEKRDLFSRVVEVQEPTETPPTQEVRPPPKPPPEPQVAARGRLYVTAEPQGAQIRLLGTDISYRPGILLETGLYQVEVSLSGYETKELPVMLGAGEERNVPVVLKAIVTKAKLYVNAEPEGSRIRILNIGPPYRRGMELKAGRYHVEVSKEGYETDKRWVMLSSGEDEPISIRLEPVKVSTPVLRQPQGVFTNNLRMKFVYIKPGSFMMGSPSDEPGRDSDETQHRVTLTKGFYLQTTEVTQGQWKAVMGNNLSRFKSCGDNCPVERVSWDDCQKFIKKLNRMQDKHRYRLPTEAEWEYAVRAGTNTAFNWGDKADCSKANYGNGYSSECKGTNPGKTMEVGSFSPNAWGLYDMHGNVWEWVQDWKGDYPTGSVTDPEGPSSGSYRVYRGGGWGNVARSCRSADRGSNAPGRRRFNLGFRLACGAVAE